MYSDLKNKTILITGASSGIGKECAIELSKLGAVVIITGRNQENLNHTHSQLSTKGEMICADISTEEGVNELIESLPKIDGAVFSAGVSHPLPTKFIKQKHIEETFTVNLNAIVLLCGRLQSKKKMNPESSLVFISSGATKYPYVGGAMYTASKLALDGYVKVLALELASKKIRCNTISPNFVKTPLLGAEEQIIMEEAIEKHKNIHPLGMGEPKDVAGAAAYLLSSESKWVTGTNLFLGGGI